MMAAGALIQELGRHEAKLKGQSLKQWKQFAHADVIGEAMKEIEGEAAKRHRERLKGQAAAHLNGAQSAAAEPDGAARDEGAPAETNNPTGTEDAA